MLSILLLGTQDLLSQFSLGIFYSSPSAFDDLMMEFINSPQIEDLNLQYYNILQYIRG